jgi:3-oxoacyl-[acyl-carrier protein] reductase
MDLGLAGKRAAVAGASSGLGLGCARALAAEGVQVAMASRTRERIERAAATVDGGIALVADVGTVEGATGFVEAAAEALGGVDILIANAGGPPPGSFASTDVSAYNEALALNLLSTVAMCKAAIPLMEAQRWGRIVAITSIAVRQPVANLILSNTARAGVTGFLRTVATEVASSGITVNSLQPGVHLTDRMSQLAGDDVEALAAQVPSRTVGNAEDFGMVAAFLCSEAAKFITGTAIPVDGGAFSGLQ